MTKDEALKLALDFIEKVNKDGWILADFEPQMYSTIAAIKEALAQPEQEPVAWMDEEMTCIFFDAERPEPFDFDFWKPLYATPPQRKPLTEKRIEELYSFWVVDCQDIVGFARAVERTVKGEV